MNLHLLLLTVDTLCVESPVRYIDSFIAIETYICMTSVMMLDITMEVSINKSLPIKGRPQAQLGHSLSWALSGTLDTLALSLGRLYSFGLWAKFT